jgi:hypothetical protein
MKTSALFIAILPAVLAQSSPIAQTIDTVIATATCEPHGDHWHCPSGVSEPTTAPALIFSTAVISPTVSLEDHDHDHSHAVTATTCEPHNDHWHCPSGLAAPTTKPAPAIISTTVTGSMTTTAFALAQQSGAAVPAFKNGGIMGFVVGVVGLLFV